MMRDETTRLRANPAYRLARWTVPWIAMLALMYVVWTVWLRFPDMQAESEATNKVTTSTVEASSTLVLGMTGVVTAEKLVLRDGPDTTAAELGSLSRDEPFEIIEKRGTWYKVRDGEGHLGWMLPDPDVVKIETKKAP
jgi:SH3-like domain-containing protein